MTLMILFADAKGTGLQDRIFLLEEGNPVTLDFLLDEKGWEEGETVSLIDIGSDDEKPYVVLRIAEIYSPVLGLIDTIALRTMEQ